MDDDLSKLAKSFWPRIQKIARRMRERYGWRMAVEDLEQLGNMGLMRAHDTYDPTRGSHEKWAIKNIKGAMQSGARTERRQNRVQRASAAVAAGAHKVNRAELGAVVLRDEIPDVIGWLLAEAESQTQRAARGSAEEIVLNEELISLLPSMLHQLTERQQRCIDLYFFQNKDQFEIARTLGINQSNVSRALAESMHSLREMLDSPPPLEP